MHRTAGGPSELRPDFRTYTDDAARTFPYASIHHDGSKGLAVHLSAFFGKWGNAKPYRDQFQGYFHRLKMLGSCADHDWLFLCDSYGAFRNGTYYLGEHGDIFVERAIVEITRREMASRRLDASQVVTIGSSMGATGALTLALHLGAAGIVAIVPHIDLDIAANRCGRFAEVAFACADSDPNSMASTEVTHRVRCLLEGYSPQRPPPRLFIQSVADDVAVHELQVLPYIEEWHGRGGEVVLDVRPAGGHTSDFATRPLLLDVTARFLDGRPVDPTRYALDPAFAGTLTQLPWTHRVRRQLKLGRLRRLAGR